MLGSGQPVLDATVPASLHSPNFQRDLPTVMRIFLDKLGLAVVPLRARRARPPDHDAIGYEVPVREDYEKQ
eukprot:1385806-Pyramimonas_sp.AAC.1